MYAGPQSTGNRYLESVSEITSLHEIAGPGSRNEMNLSFLPLFSLGSTALLAIVVVSMLVVVLLVTRNYHKGLRTREVILAQSTVLKEEPFALEN